MVFKCGPLEQQHGSFIDSAPAAELIASEELSYLPNCSLGLAIFTCAPSVFQKGVNISLLYHLPQ